MSDEPTTPAPVASNAASAVLLTVAYEGGGFSGYALQRDARTIAGVLGEAIASVQGDRPTLRGVSRTDAGVHARGQRVAFDATRPLEPRSWVLGLNGRLPSDLAVRAAVRVPAGYDPRGHVVSKRYRYSLLLDRVRDPMIEGRVWRIERALDLGRLRGEAEALLGTHDFRAFRSAADERTMTTRTIDRCALEVDDEHAPRRVDLVVEGKAFMHNMVRIIAGTLVDVARGRLPEGTVRDAFEHGDRRRLGMTAPAFGLCLEHVELRVPEIEPNVPAEQLRWP